MSIVALFSWKRTASSFTDSTVGRMTSSRAASEAAEEFRRGHDFEPSEIKQKRPGGWASPRIRPKAFTLFDEAIG
jgi:hypothetical protein